MPEEDRRGDNGEKANYILAVKDNRESLHKEIIDMISKADTPAFMHYLHGCDTWSDKYHGRVEEWECKVINKFGWLHEIHSWKGAECIVKVSSSVFLDGKTTREESFYISPVTGLTAETATNSASTGT